MPANWRYVVDRVLWGGCGLIAGAAIGLIGQWGQVAMASLRNWFRSERTKRLLCLQLPLVYLLVLAVVSPLAVPPWDCKYAAMVQRKFYQWTEWTGWSWNLHTFPRDFTGTLRFWDENGQLRHESQYRNGLRHGFEIDYDETGRPTNACEYRDDYPWDGLCYIRQRKAYRGEFRQGKPWNGLMPLRYKDPARSGWGYIQDGEIVMNDEGDEPMSPQFKVSNQRKSSEPTSNP